jgi:TolB protein
LIATRFAASSALLVAAAAAASACAGGDDPARLIVYEAQRNASVNIYTIDARDGATTQLTHDEKFTGNPAWSPDRKRIVFSSNRDTGMGLELYIMDADGSDAQRLTTTPDSEYSGKFSPDGSRIAYVINDAAGWTLWLMDADGSGARRLTDTYKFAEFPAWSRDGKRLVFSARTAGAPADILGVDIETGAVTTVIATPGADACPHFSSDGETLTYGSQREGPAGFDVYAHDMSSDDTSGRGDRRLTDAPERDDYANWGPGDREIVFTSQRDGNIELYLMSRDGSNQRRLTTTIEARENVPDW